MKKFILSIFFTTASMVIYAQSGGGAYGQLQVPNSNTSQNAQYWAKTNQQNKKIVTAEREANLKLFSDYVGKGITSYNNGYYAACIQAYEDSKNLGFYNSELELAVGYSYFSLYNQTKKKKFKNKAKKFLKKSKRHGNVNAELFLDKHF